MNSSAKTLISLLCGPVVFALVLVAGMLTGTGGPMLNVAAVAAWMVSWWMIEAAPIAVTALLPIILFPIMGISDLKETTANFSNPTIYLFMGGFMLALAMEKTGLHKRIAFFILKLTGSHANGIILGFFITTALLSMWVSNTATTLMMLPIGLSVIQLLENHASGPGRNFKNFSMVLTLGIAYAATIGGLGTVIGTPPNALTKSFIEKLTGQEVSFLDWMILGVPLVVVLLSLTYGFMVLAFPNRLGRIQGVDKVMGDLRYSLGRMKKEEWVVVVIFGLTAMTWIVGGLINSLTKTKYFDDTIIALIGGLLMFLVPLSLQEKKFILEWPDVRRLPWDILLLFGGGLSLANGMEKSGIMQAIGSMMSESGISPHWLLLIMITLVLALSELMSNVALAGIFVPVAISIARYSGQDELMYAVTCGIATSYGFIMPIATPPNAIVYGAGHISIKEMAKAGVWVNLIAILVTYFLVQWLVPLMR
jgi:sodium-dependent dicarboxylate transporter 2/3/5